MRSDLPLVLLPSFGMLLQTSCQRIVLDRNQSDRQSFFADGTLLHADDAVTTQSVTAAEQHWSVDVGEFKPADRAAVGFHLPKILCKQLRRQKKDKLYHPDFQSSIKLQLDKRSESSC